MPKIDFMNNVDFIIKVLVSQIKGIMSKLVKRNNVEISKLE